jgi:hypothetical protein
MAPDGGTRRVVCWLVMVMRRRGWRGDVLAGKQDLFTSEGC